ncbi:MAG: hypothetical protein COA57_11020, partial [Flavobacteriales bacterium]
MGIGISTPTEKLDVAGKTKTTDFQMTNGAANHYVLTTDASGNASWSDPATITTANDGDWTDNGTNVYRLNGNVGIGTSNPFAAKLVARGSATSGIDFLIAAENSVSHQLILVFDEDNDVWRFRASGVAHPFAFNRYGTELVRIETSGNMGIGTATPSQKLEVIGNAKVHGTIESNAGGFKFPDGTVQTTASSLDGGMSATFNELQVIEHIKVGNNSLYLGDATQGNIGPTLNNIWTTNGDLLLQPDMSSLNTAFGTQFNTIINPKNGTVGIGTNSPQKKLHINRIHAPVFGGGTVLSSTRGGIRIEDGVDNGLSITTSIWDIDAIAEEQKLFIGTPGSPVLALTDDGRIGIGTTTPLAELEVKNGSVLFEGTTGG